MNWNDYFNPIINMNDVQYATLIQEGRLFSTIAWMTGVDAAYHLDVGESCILPDGFYYGFIVTKTPEDISEAIKIANERGWGEEVRARVVTRFHSEYFTYISLN
jgi:hypothetical protein